MTPRRKALGSIPQGPPPNLACTCAPYELVSEFTGALFGFNYQTKDVDENLKHSNTLFIFCHILSHDDLCVSGTVASGTHPISPCCRLVVQATDRGSPALSGTAVIRVQVVDVNDNRPAIPPMRPVVVAESKTISY